MAIRLDQRLAWPGRPPLRARRREVLADPVAAVIRSAVADSFDERPAQPVLNPIIEILIHDSTKPGLSLLGIAKAAIDGVELAGIVGNDRTVAELSISRLRGDVSSVLSVRVVTPDGEVYESRTCMLTGDVRPPATLGGSVHLFAPTTSAAMRSTLDAGNAWNASQWRLALARAVAVYRREGSVSCRLNVTHVDAILSKSALFITVGRVSSDIDNVAAMTMDLLEAARPSLYPRDLRSSHIRRTHYEEESSRIPLDRLLKSIHAVVRQDTRSLDIRIRRL